MIYQVKPTNPKLKDVYFDGKIFWIYLEWGSILDNYRDKKLTGKLRNKTDWFHITNDSSERRQLRKEKLNQIYGRK